MSCSQASRWVVVAVAGGRRQVGAAGVGGGWGIGIARSRGASQEGDS